jgi:hypothetical protein
VNYSFTVCATVDLDFQMMLTNTNGSRISVNKRALASLNEIVQIPVARRAFIISIYTFIGVH